MDYLDTRKQTQRRIILMVGYVCITIAIIIGTVILKYEAYGFGLGKNGTVIQNGLLFISSNPNPAQIYLNGVLNKSKTNTRLFVPANTYNAKLTRTGYNDWQRSIDVEGDSVVHFDYPFLFPTKLTTTKLEAYSSSPGIVTQSPDRRWVLVQQPGTMTGFDLYDLKNPTKEPVSISVPTDLLSSATTSESWQLEEWADDNQHVLLQHIYDGKSEYILVDRQNPTQSINLDTTLGVTPTKISLDNKKFDQYYLYDQTAGTLETANQKSPTPVAYLDHVLGYASYSDDTMLYATDSDAPSGKAIIKLQVGTQTYIIHSVTASPTYVLDLTKYSNVLYVAAGGSSEDKVYIYKDPIAQLTSQPDHAIVPAQVLRVTDPNYISFSTNTQFIMVENATQFGVYDLENQAGYSYTETSPLDAPQQNATWMDGDRLAYVSSGKLTVADYDNTNKQVLMPDNASFIPIFGPDYKYVYGFTPAASTGQVFFTQTPLLTPADL